MNTQYHPGMPVPGPPRNGLHSTQYPQNAFVEDEDDDEAPLSYTDTLESVTLGTNEENLQLLNQVDQLRECRVDEYIDLPQIVVVGDQSAGKSSVLDALTDIPFPRDSIKCTRFATEIRLRRSPEVKTMISILPDKERSPEDKQRLEGFKQTLQDHANFDTIFASARDEIFLRGRDHNFLANDILRIEVSGRKQPHLTVVDLPGIIHSAHMNTTAADKDAISTLAKFYMKKERSIILPVVSGSNDISNQVVLELAKELDPKGVRTLGIITKPDMTLTEKRESEFILLASNKDKKNKLQLGWHVLRNRAHDEMHFKPEERKLEEIKFFANSNWGAKLKPSQLGIDALSKRLSKQLIRHIAAEVFKVEADIDRELKKCTQHLEQLGDGKDTPEEMRQELFTWCELSRKMTLAAVQGHGINPSGEDFFASREIDETYARNLRSRVVRQNYAFAAQMENWGSDCLIVNDERSHNEKIQARTGDSRPSIPEISRSEYISKVVYPHLRDNRGQELSMDSNALHVYRLFHSHSKHWPEHAAQHVQDTYRLCEEFLNQVIQLVWPKQLQNRIRVSFIQGEVDRRLKKAQMELENLKADRLKLVTPYESEFVNKYYAWKESDNMKQNTEGFPEQKYEDILKKMQLLYQSNLKTFIANVITQVVERHISDHLEDVFHDQRVRNLTDREVRDLVEDDYEVRTERQDLRQQEAILAKGKEICKQIGMRSDLGPYEPKLHVVEESQTPSRFHTNGAFTHRPNPHSPHSHSYPTGGSSTPGSSSYADTHIDGQNWQQRPYGNAHSTVWHVNQGSAPSPQTPRPSQQGTPRPENRKPVPTMSNSYVEVQTSPQWKNRGLNAEYERSTGQAELLRDEVASMTSTQQSSQHEDTHSPGPARLKKEKSGRKKKFLGLGSNGDHES